MNWKKFPPHLRAPNHWPATVKKQVETLITDFDIDDPPGLLLLISFGNAATRETECREQIEIDGQTILDRFGQKKAHPLLATERDARSAKLQALKALHFDCENETTKKPGRPGNGLGV